MQTLRIAVFGVLFTLAYANFPLQLVNASSVVTAAFTDSVLLIVPPCTFAEQMASLTYQNTATKETVNLQNVFAVPSCRKRRDLVVVSQSNGQSISSQYLGYQVNNLVNGTQYSFQYTVGSNTSDVLLASTVQAAPYSTIYDGLPARSGAMVVITVILVITIFLLIVGFVLTIIYGHCMK
ncbi:uroplakin-2 [Brienomyrus brachyistius]|uniref:uroplakin-2 n=1 Tax=Brienomyrus brachyistius TaxID=42636 RepID=UPI0020B23D25|nr:uroplakin-2 [Brienomyrus brachyistius]